MRPLEEIVSEYNELRDSFKIASSRTDLNKEALLEFQHRFLDLKADLREWHVKMLHSSEMRSDKGATAIKMRIAVAMIKGEYAFSEGEKAMYNNPPTITNADKYAAATTEYKKFLKERTFYKESFTNISDLREDIQNYIILIRDKHNK